MYHLVQLDVYQLVQDRGDLASNISSLVFSYEALKAVDSGTLPQIRRAPDEV
jgi:hypothetical protein